ncbi:MAG: hypothetical protein LW650_08290 [Planctomycetaceae bacterium]|nr:hypothetical protein [Planctomycetaceae bacterium]
MMHFHSSDGAASITLASSSALTIRPLRWEVTPPFSAANGLAVMMPRRTASPIRVLALPTWVLTVAIDSPARVSSARQWAASAGVMVCSTRPSPSVLISLSAVC